MSLVRSRAGARGLVAAMSMSGMRQLTTSLGLVGKVPPEAMLSKVAPDQMRRLSPETRSALTEAVHWTYGAVGGVGYGLLPAAVRRRAVSGPAYGVVVWLVFELGLAPLLGIGTPHGKVMGRAMLMADHVLYGVVVAGRLAPEPEA